MADQDTSLPVRSQADGTDERVHVKIVDGTTTPAVNQTQVDDDNNLHVELHGNDPGGADKVVRTSEGGALTPDGVYVVLNNTKPGNIGLIATTRAIAADSIQTERLTSIAGTGNVRALDVSMHDEAGVAYSVTNPLPVFVSETEGGAPIHKFHPSAADVAVGGTETYDYTVTLGKTMKFSQFLASASGKIKAELWVDLGTGLTLQAVYFNSAANPNIETAWNVPFTVAAGLKVRFILTNRDNNPMPVYGTLVGVEN
jgi:hypothetical protein